MIVRITGKLIEKREQSLIIYVQGFSYEVIVPTSVLQRIDNCLDQDGQVHLVTHHYFQINPSGGVPVLIGFLNELERDFFQQFIKVSGIGPRAAVRALDKPIQEITRAIDQGDIDYLKTLSGIGVQRAKEIVAKLQGKVSRFGLIQDTAQAKDVRPLASAWQEEALSVLMQLQYKKNEAMDMIDKAMKRSQGIQSAEDLLNEVYKQKVRG